VILRKKEVAEGEELRSRGYIKVQRDHRIISSLTYWGKGAKKGFTQSKRKRGGKRGGGDNYAGKKRRFRGGRGASRRRLSYRKKARDKGYTGVGWKEREEQESREID